MLKKIQRFGGAMFTPILFYALAGVIVGLTSLFQNQQVFGSLANPNTLWYKIWDLVNEGGWTVFRQMPLLFAIGLPIGLAKKANARACLETFALYVTFNYFINAFLTLWNFGVDINKEIGGTSGLTNIAGIKTLDTSIIGAIIISGVVVYIHNRYFDKKLPDYLGIFQGSVLVYLIGFVIMMICAFITVLVWPKVQILILTLQGFLISSGSIGVWGYTFLERLLIPTGLHHFIYGPFIFGPAVVEGGIYTYWAQHLEVFSKSSESLKILFPAGGFALHGNSKIFGSPGIAFAIYKTAREERKKTVAGLLIPATLTAMISGISEPLEFTFLFVAPILFVVHSVLAATMSTIMYMLGIVGNFGGGGVDFLFQNWIPMFKNHSFNVILQILIGLIFTFIYYVVFKYLIIKMQLQTPGREEVDTESDLFNKNDNKKENYDIYLEQATQILEALGGAENIEELNNCATRLRVSVKDFNLVLDDLEFKKLGVHGVLKKGNAIQVIVGLSVPQIKETIEVLMNTK